MKTITKRYFPPDLTEVINGDYGIECRFSNELMRAILYRGKSAKPLWHYRFRSLEAMREKIKTSIKNITDNEQTKEQERERKKKLNTSLKACEHFKVGDIVLNTWGYEQTNVEFYQVIEIKNKTIVVREVSQKQTKATSHDSANVIPEKDCFIDKPFSLRLKYHIWNDKPEVGICNPQSYYYFHRWDGGEQHKSWGY